MREDVERLASVYRAALAAKGPVPQGLLWPNVSDVATRFWSLLRPIEFSEYGPGRRLALLDLGCGPGLLLDYLAAASLLNKVDYFGVDVFSETLDEARKRWPHHRFELRDVRDEPLAEAAFDYCLVCGVLTGRFSMPYSAMEAMARETLTAIWPSVRVGLGFNVMSKHVDWERDDLFHWPLDDIMSFCRAKLSRHVSLHLDYGLWETTVLVRKEPIKSAVDAPDRWFGIER